MGRPKRAGDGGGVIYHTLNRSNARLPIFETEENFDAFVAVIGQAVFCAGA
jgi:hypothetical protein